MGLRSVVALISNISSVFVNPSFEGVDGVCSNNLLWQVIPWCQKSVAVEMLPDIYTWSFYEECVSVNS
jgi:hypothetical protein